MELFYKMPRLQEEECSLAVVSEFIRAHLLCGHHVQDVRGTQHGCEWVSVFVPGGTLHTFGKHMGHNGH